MKKRYLTLLAVTAGCMLDASAQSVTKIYDHDTNNLTYLQNMPFDESRMIVVDGFVSAYQSEFYEFDEANSQLVPMIFGGVDSVSSFPTMFEDKMFFSAYTPSQGKELAYYDGTSTYVFDLNNGAGDSDPRMTIFEDELYIRANDGTAVQLFKFLGGTSFQQLTQTSDDVAQFVARRGDSYYYSTFSPQNGRQLMKTEDNNGVLSFSNIAPLSYQESIEDVVLMNGDIHILSAAYTFVDAFYRIDRVDGNDVIQTNYNEIGLNFSSAHLFEYNNNLIYYRTEPNHSEVLNLTSMGAPIQQLQLTLPNNDLIGEHVVKDGKMFFYGRSFVVDASGSIDYIIDDGDQLQLDLGYDGDHRFYLYELHNVPGNPSGIVEINTLSNTFNRYEVTTEGYPMFINSPMVENNGDIKFIFNATDPNPMTDIYSFTSVYAGQSELELASFDVYPNPSLDGTLHVSLMEANLISIVTAEGKIVETIEGVAGVNTLHIKAPGVYFISAGGTTQKLVVK